MLEAQKILEEALTLPENERAKLAASLIDSLDAESDEGVEEAWRAEVARRVQEIDEGRVTMVDWAEARRSILG